MGRVLGRVDYGDGETLRYFIHCDTAGSSFTPLFADEHTAWNAYDAGGSAALHVAVPPVSTKVWVIRKMLAFARSFRNDEQLNGPVLFGLATADRLLTPIQQYGEVWRSLLQHDGVLHVAERGDAGFFGVTDEPICGERWSSFERDKVFNFEEFYGQPLPLCASCVARLIGKPPNDPVST
ncbi:hypothetical protein KPB05_36470 [Burkholderia gladioli]|uniref:hypothetical protein n=1 Tax=Burkholderia gladioli TaxID=28095 RepID=UPI002854FC8F|nr:hypothetical protein [Burkholderia gladioli]MDR8092955.1 hypothetical protein [Burkholderia gladioli]